MDKETPSTIQIDFVESRLHEPPDLRPGRGPHPRSPEQVRALWQQFEREARERRADVDNKDDLLDLLDTALRSAEDLTLYIRACEARVNRGPGGRELALAQTKLEEVVHRLKDAQRVAL
jgi:hypothetical protein